MRGHCWGTWLIMLGFMDLRWPRVFCRRSTPVLLDKAFIGLISNVVDTLLWCSPVLINFGWCSAKFPSFLGLWLVEQFPHICIQIADQIELKFGGPTHYGPTPAWLTFDHAFALDSLPFWFNSQWGLVICFYEETAQPITGQEMTGI